LASTPGSYKTTAKYNQYNVLDSQSTDGTSFSYDKDGNKYDSGSYKTEAVGIDVYGTVRVSKTTGDSGPRLRHRRPEDPGLIHYHLQLPRGRHPGKTPIPADSAIISPTIL